MNRFHRANRDRWNLGAAEYAARQDRRGTWRIAPRQPETVFLEQELDLIGSIEGRQVCVLGSGDNLAVFAFAGMGARVTSVDISAEQLAVARGRASELGLEVEFVEADVTALHDLESGSFDLVYTADHVGVWVSDLRAFYREAIRILRPSGLFLITEYHPFRRVWKDREDRLELMCSYHDNGPHEYDLSEDLGREESDDARQFEFHWTVAQYLNAVIEQGADLVKFDEIGDGPESWEHAPLQGLPRQLLIAGRKR